jgi:hypothetical protein
MTEDLYQQLVAITEDYLGPAAPRFVDRQIDVHLGKKAQEIIPEDLPRLIEWTKVTLSLLTRDQKVIEEYGRRMSQLMQDASLSPNVGRRNL